MVDAPWLSPRENSGAFFISWSTVKGQGSRVSISSPCAPPAPYLPLSPSALEGGITSGKGRLIK